MSEVNFKSTYRIPVTQQGINKTKKNSLKALVNSYGGLVGTGNTGYARVSIPNSKDIKFLQKLKGLGYKVFQVFQGENINKKDLDEYIKERLASGEFVQKGKQKAQSTITKFIPKTQNSAQTAEKVSNDVFTGTKSSPKQETRVSSYKRYEFGNWEKESNKAEQERIRNTDEYKNAVKKYGEEAAEALYFFTRKEKI